MRWPVWFLETGRFRYRWFAGSAKFPVVLHRFVSGIPAIISLGEHGCVIPSQLDPRLTRLLTEPGVTDVLISGTTGCWVSRGAALEVRSNPFGEAGDLERVAVELVTAGGRRLDAAQPFADVVVGDLRIHAFLKSASSSQTQLSLRFLGERQRALSELAHQGMFSRAVLDGLQQLMAARENFLICGPTGSGKTTLLRALMLECAEQRIITIEDLPELRLDGASVPLLARHSNVEGAGEIGLEQLLIESLRMRPDRIVVGELRSRELLVLLQALNTGHSGSGATLHANSLSSVPARLHAIGLMSGVTPEQLNPLLLGSIKWVIQLGFAKGSGQRRIVGIGQFSAHDGQLDVIELAA